MEDKNKYFTPDIEDIRMGYECELFKWVGWKQFKVNNTYFDGDGYGDFPEIFSALTDYKFDGNKPKDKIRTPYLTKEQIEAEGWEYKQTNNIRWWYEKQSPEIGGNWYGYNIYKSKLIHDPEMNYVKILFSFDAVEYDPVFEGECKDINTLRYISKLLHI